MNWKTIVSERIAKGESISRSLARELGVAWSTLSMWYYRQTQKDSGDKVKAHKLNGDIKILCFDLETFPILGAVWSLWNNNVGINQIERDWSILSYAAKWVGSDMTVENVIYNDVRNQKDINDDSKLLQELWDLLDEADIVLTKNGDRFDIPKLNARFVMAGLPPPSHYKSIDLDKICKRHFGFTSRKLEYLSNELNEKFKKLKHSKFAGYEMWKQCLARNIDAFNECKEYNVHDVLATEELYYTLAPWSDKIGSFFLYSDDKEFKCNCGCKEVKHVGYAYTALSKFDKYQCANCGKNYRGRKNLLTIEKREAIMMNISQ